MLPHRPEEIWGDDYVRWIERADAAGEVPGAEVWRRYLDALQIAPDHAVLDLGVGTGRLLTDLLTRAGFVCGIDLSMTMMARARERLGRSAILVKGDGQRLPFADRSFDRIVAWAVWENIPNQRHALAEVARVLRPGGRLLFTSKNLTNARNLRLAWWRVKQELVRRLWRWICARPQLLRRIPHRLRAKCERVMARVEVPQYPTFWPSFVLAARRLGMKVVLLHKFAGGTLEDPERAPDGAWTHQQFVAILERQIRG